MALVLNEIVVIHLLVMLLFHCTNIKLYMIVYMYRVHNNCMIYAIVKSVNAHMKGALVHGLNYQKAKDFVHFVYVKIELLLYQCCQNDFSKFG